ncbi:MAG TPA: signal peptidase II [Bacillota bacterium]|nr:signal peptidase II [Bacillota bacterium]
MKIAYKKTWISVFFLIAIEQGIKIMINHFALNKNTPILAPFLYFKPMFNRDYSWLNSMLQLGINRWVHIATVVIMIIFIYWFYRFLNQRIGNNNTINLLFALVFSAAICSLLDKIFWNGSLDYILLKGFFTFDLKDVYINIAIGLLILLLILKNRALQRLDEQKLLKDFTKYILGIFKGKP